MNPFLSFHHLQSCFSLFLSIWPLIGQDFMSRGGRALWLVSVLRRRRPHSGIQEVQEWSGEHRPAVAAAARWNSATMWISVAVICVALAGLIWKYVWGSSGPNPFDTDTREPLKKMVHDRKEKNKVLKQGERVTRVTVHHDGSVLKFLFTKTNVKSIKIIYIYI